MSDLINQKIITRWSSDSQSGLLTNLEEEPVPKLEHGQILVEMLYVPMHGSFWLATHPDAIHPRIREFMEKGYFVFGNGGVGKVIESKEDPRQVQLGDYVCVFGHVPCTRYDCYACTVLHRYVECDYGESGILGHGKNAPDGTYARYAILPKYTYNVCYRESEKPTIEQLKSFMFAFLMADVRNALTRHPDTLRQRRLLLIGAGYSGHIAAYIHNRSCPEAKIFVVDSNPDHLEAIKAIDPDDIETFQLEPHILTELNLNHLNPTNRHELDDVVQTLASAIRKFFNGRLANLLFDSTSGNSSPLWDNEHILGPSMHCIPFGFGSQNIILGKEIIQLSGLHIGMSRGVGNLRNRLETVELIKAGAGIFLNKLLVNSSDQLDGMEQAAKFIQDMHVPPRALHEIEHAYIAPNKHESTTK